MTPPRITRFYLPPPHLRLAEAGKDRLINRISDVLRKADFQVEFHDTRTARSDYDGYTLFSMEPANSERSASLRECYHPVFHRIEKSNKRWLWDVAKKRFDQADIDRNRAEAFYRTWQKELFGDAPAAATRDGSILIPLQARLTKHRSFQASSPVEMIRKTATHFPDRAIHLTTHPTHSYSSEERAVLGKLIVRFSNVEMFTGTSTEALARCDFVVTQNSSVGFHANFFGKPAIHFAKIDFHHIALDVTRVGPFKAFERIETHEPDYAGYVWWFWQKNAINLRRVSAEDRIRRRLRKFGWPI